MAITFIRFRTTEGDFTDLENLMADYPAITVEEEGTGKFIATHAEADYPWVDSHEVARDMAYDLLYRVHGNLGLKDVEIVHGLGERPLIRQHFEAWGFYDPAPYKACGTWTGENCRAEVEFIGL